MKPVTQDMIEVFRINKLKYDFMGYTFNNKSQLSFHHLIIPKRESREAGIGEGYLFWNGAILRQDTSHEYLHTIERIDRSTFEHITDIMIYENQMRQLDIESLKRIREYLLEFEMKYRYECSKSGKRIIKPQYVKERIDLHL